MATMLPRVMPLPKMILAHPGTAVATFGCAVTSMATPSEEARMTMLRWSLRSTLLSVWMPTTATVANMARAAPPSTGRGTPATTAAALGSSPRMIMMAPAEATTQRLLILVSRTSPTFSAKQVYGERVEDPADRRRQAIGAKCPCDVRAGDPLVDDCTGGEDVTGGLDRRDEHDDDHRYDRGADEDRGAEVEGRGHADDGTGAHRAEARVS